MQLTRLVAALTCLVGVFAAWVDEYAAVLVEFAEAADLANGVYTINATTVAAALPVVGYNENGYSISLSSSVGVFWRIEDASQEMVHRQNCLAAGSGGPFSYSIGLAGCACPWAVGMPVVFGVFPNNTVDRHNPRACAPVDHPATSTPVDHLATSSPIDHLTTSTPIDHPTTPPRIAAASPSPPGDTTTPAHTSPAPPAPAAPSCDCSQEVAFLYWLVPAIAGFMLISNVLVWVLCFRSIGKDPQYPRHMQIELERHQQELEFYQREQESPANCSRRGSQGPTEKVGRKCSIPSVR
ncbi:hypothetical protein DIPPA_23382 [Diplonema papillatum]|nr:hypothetical protein DIPPA_23382 [Diplonema papillatum]